MVEIFASIGGAFGRVGELCKDIRRCYEDKVADVFKLYKDELVSMKELVQEWKQTKLQINKFDEQLQMKKKEVINNIPMNNWYIKESSLKPVAEKEFSFVDMMPTEFKYYEMSKDIYGYYCNRLPEEFKAMWEKNEKEFRENFSIYFKESLNIFEQVKFLLKID